MRMLKATSSKWINDNKFIKDNKFQWQNAPLNDAVGQGYGAFSYSRSQRNNVINYMNQEEHHKVKTFREEYLIMFKKFEIEYKDEYVFEFYDD